MKKGLVILVFAICCACSNQKEHQEKPAYVLDQKEFVDILAEIQIAESAYIKSTQRTKAKRAQLANNTKAILNDFHISAGKFDSSLKYYQLQPELMIQIYDSVIVTLEQTLSNMENNKKKPKS